MNERAILPSIFVATNSLTGIIVGVTLILLWLVSLIGFLNLNLATVSPLLIISAVLLRAFLHTGLFITTHEAIHGNICTHRPLNNAIGYLTAWLYALLPYQVLATNHKLHHCYPASDRDPDFYPANSRNFLLWYLHFMKEYQQGQQAWVLLIGMTVIFWVFVNLNLALFNIFLFWVIPILISSLQLFTFGIFLPHRQPSEGYRDRHRTNSSNYSVFWSLITCYHFGYHWEHHQYPHVPWYKLPLKKSGVAS
jgi:beta-carotene/zeaxanthin 4-ketolase